ncbi:MAG: hypothetical protein AB9866_21235 [Syntrophobacteraceae bacterium]
MQKIARTSVLLLLWFVVVCHCLPGPVMAAAERDSAVITIDIDSTADTLDRLLFGHNILLGSGLWSTTTDSVDPVALSHIQALTPGILRFPGGSVSDLYAWEDGVGVRTSSPAAQTGSSLTLEEAPDWRGIKKARFLDSSGGSLGDPFFFLKVQGNRLEGVSGASSPHPAGTMVRPDPRPGQPEWMINSYGIMEHMKTAKTLGSAVVITVNYGTGLDRAGAISTSASLNQRIKRAAAFVAFCNGSPSDSRPLGIDDEGNDWNSIGYWARKRRNLGVPEPYRILFWEVGNEVFDESEKGFTSAREYARDFLLFSKAMKAVDSGIKIGAVGMSSPRGRGAADRSDEWNPTLIRIAGEDMDFLIVHPYYPAAIRKKADYNSKEWFSAVMAGADQALSDLREIRSMLDAGSPRAKSVVLAITEYGIWPVDSKEGADFSNLARTVYDMDLLAGLIRERASLGVNLAASWNLHGSNQTALIRYDWKTGIRVLRPHYFAYKMAGTALLPKVLNTKVKCPAFRPARVGNVSTRDEVPLVNAVATLSENGKQLALLVINRSPSSAVSCIIQAGGFNPAEVTITTLAGSGPGAHNETSSGTVVPGSKSLSGMASAIALPPHSVSLIEAAR